MNKRAVSEVVVMVVILALLISISAVVFTLTRKTVEEKIEKAEACGPEIIGKLSLNSEYVCYDSVNKEIYFSINREDIALDKLIVAVETETEIKQFELKEDEETNDLFPFRVGGSTALPAKNSGRTYIGKIDGEPIGIKIFPVINEEQCEVADFLNEVISCS